MRRGFSSHQQDKNKKRGKGGDPDCVIFLPPRRMVHQRGEEREDGRSPAKSKEYGEQTNKGGKRLGRVYVCGVSVNDSESSSHVRGRATSRTTRMRQADKRGGCM